MLWLTGEIFEVDATFNPDQYRAEAFGVVRDKPMNVAIRFTAAQALYVRERQWHPAQHIRELGGGDIELRFRAGGIFEITRWILGWGAAAEVWPPHAPKPRSERPRRRLRVDTPDTLPPHRTYAHPRRRPGDPSCAAWIASRFQGSMSRNAVPQSRL